MKKIIAALLLSLMPLMAMEAKTPEVEMYPDEVPKYQLVKTLDLSDEFKWHDEAYQIKKDKSIRVGDACEQVRSIFSRKGFIESPNSLSIRGIQRGYKASLFFWKEKEIEDFIFVDLQYSEKSYEPRLSRQTGFMNPNIYKESKWELPKTKNKENLIKDSAHEGSWKWVDASIHEMTKSTIATDQRSIFYKRVYQDICEKGLQRAVSRISIIIDQNKNAYFYTLYKNENENKRNEKLIRSILG